MEKPEIRQKELEKELLEWKERQFLLRKQYKNTPPGFNSQEEEHQMYQELKKIRQMYEESCGYRLFSSYETASEIFVGRQEYLNRIESCLAEKQGPVVLYGIGGIGKTALARAAVRRMRDRYSQVLFLSYNSGLQELICDDTQVSVSNLHYSKDKYKNKSQYFKEKMKILHEIVEKSKVLLVIDDCNAESDRRMDAVFSLPCDILVTTRIHPSLWGHYKGILVRELESEKEWRDFIQAYQRKDLSEQEKEELLHYRNKVHGHTLLMMLKIHGVEAEHEGAAADFSVDLFKRVKLKKDEKQVLRELSIMPVQGISEELYFKVSKVKKESVYRLADCLLLRREVRIKEGRETAVLSLHPIIAEAAQRVFRPTAINCRNLFYGFSSVLLNVWNNHYLENQALEPYAFALLEAFPNPVAWMARPFDGLITLLWIQGYFEEAKKYCRRLVRATEDYYGVNHQITGEIYLRMAAVYYNSMDFSQADPWYLKGFYSLKHSHPFDDYYYHRLGVACLKLSRMYRYQGKPEKALHMVEAAAGYTRKYWDLCKEKKLHQSEEIAPENTYCHCQLNKARILFDMGGTEAAWEIAKAARDTVCKEISEGIDYGYELNEFDRFLVKVLMKKKKFAQAETLSLEVMNKACRYRSSNSKEILSCWEQLADVYEAQGKREKACQEYQMIYHKMIQDVPHQREWIHRVKEKYQRCKC